MITLPSTSPEATQLPLGLNTAALTAALCSENNTDSEGF